MAFTATQTPASPLFAGMNLDERQQVLMLLEQENYPAGTEILREGESTQHLSIIVSGQCEVFILRHDKSENQLAVLDAGAVFGEMSFFHQAPHSATVRTMTPVHVMRLSRNKFDRLQEVCPSASCKIAANTAGVIANRLRRMDEWVRDFVELEHSHAQERKEEWQEFRAKLFSGWHF